MLHEAVIFPLTCFRVLTLSWMGLGKPTRVSVSLQNNTVTPEWEKTPFKKINLKKIHFYVSNSNTYFPSVNPMNLFLLVSRKCSMSFSLHTQKTVR